MQAKTFCRMCGGFCGLDAEIVDGRVVKVRGDHDHPATRGFACIKGLNAPEIHNRPERLLRPLKRVGDDFVEIGLEDALDEIADRLRTIRDEDGSQAIGTYVGTGTLGSMSAASMRKGFDSALGSQSFTTMTIDQSCKWAATERLGRWTAGKHPYELSDVWLIVGLNPLVSIWGWTVPVQNPVKEMKAAKERGTKLIVIDPRRTETANFADIHLQLNPGEDSAVAACLLNIVFANGWDDQEFCAAHVDGIEELRQAVAPFTPEFVAARAGLTADELVAAAELFAKARRAGVETGTGTSMAPHGNLSEHLYETLAVVCGHFPREGDPIANTHVTIGTRPAQAQATSPLRGYRNLPLTRVRGAARMMGETPVATLPEEITTPGPGRLRALIVSGANPAGCVPDQEKILAAFKQLDLLVTIDPQMSATARLSDYVLPPRLMFERPELSIAADVLPMSAGGSRPVPFAQYSDAIVAPPLGSDIPSEYAIWWGLAARLDLQIDYQGCDLSMTELPEERALIAHLARNSAIPFEEIASSPGAKAFDLPRPVAVAADANAGRFEVMPPDVREEVDDMMTSLRAKTSEQFPFSLISRRIREALNSDCRDLPAVRARITYNPLSMNPTDLAQTGLAAGDRVRIISDHGEIPAILAADATLKKGVVSMTHGFGPLPGEQADYEQVGSNISLLISLDRDYEKLQSMPRMSAIPVRIERNFPVQDDVDRMGLALTADRDR